MPGFSILLPPAEGKLAGGNPLAPGMFDRRASDTFNYFASLNRDRRTLIRALHEAMDDPDTDLEALFGVKGDNLEDALEANRTVMDSPLMAAMERYSPGVMYRAIDFASLPTGSQRRLLENGIIISGLYGLLRPDDLIHNYKLRIDANLPGVGKVAQYWKPIISPILNETIAGKFVWNLLPGAHREAWDDDRSYAGMVQVKFYDELEGGGRKPITHNVKPLRGALVRFIVNETAESVEDLAGEYTSVEGYYLDSEATTWDDETRTGTVVLVKPLVPPEPPSEEEES